MPCSSAAAEAGSGDGFEAPAGSLQSPVSIDGVDEGTAEELQARARDYIEAQGGHLADLSRAARRAHTAGHAEPAGLG